MKEISSVTQCQKCKGSARQEYNRDELNKLLNQDNFVYRCQCGAGDNEYSYWIPNQEQIEQARRLVDPNRPFGSPGFVRTGSRRK